MGELDAERDETFAGFGPVAETQFFGEPTPLAIPLAWEFDEDDTHVVADARTWGETWYRAAACAVVGMLGVAAVVMFSADDRNPDAGLVAPPIPVLPSAPVPTAVAPTMAPTSAPPPTLAPEDESFLAMLVHDGYPQEKIVSVPHEIALAANVCAAVQHGVAPSDVVSRLAAPRGLDTQEHAEVFVDDALAAYCPHAAIPTATHAPAALAPVDPDQRYLDDLNAGDVRVIDVGEVIRGAHEICAALEAGTSKDSIEGAIVASNKTLNEGHAATMVNSAVAVYCPRYGG